MICIDNYEEAIRLANSTRYGLSAFLFSNDYRLIMRAQRDLACGELYINRTMGEALQGFHNGHQDSGIGGEDGKTRRAQIHADPHNISPVRLGISWMSLTTSSSELDQRAACSPIV